MQNNITLKSARKFFRKSLVTLGLLCLATGIIQAQPFINGPLSTGATFSGGTAAPAGTTWSELQLTNTGLGSGANISANLTLADDFTIPAGVTWNITKVTFYGYSTGYSGATSPFNDTRVQIFSADPSTGNPTPVFGNLTTNRFAASSSADMFRTGSVTAGTTRKIWKIEATVNTSLPAGHYWIEWQHGTIAGVTSNFSPLKTVVGTTTQPGNNAKQHDIAGAAWTNLMDDGSGTAQDMPFQIDYTATGNPCTATNPGAASSTLSAACPGTSFTLSVANPGGGLGISYQWQNSTNGTTFTDIPGAVNPTLTTTQNVATWYQLKVTCGAGTPMTSTPVKVNIPAICYCLAGANDPGNEKIAKVQFGTINNSSSSTAGYEDFTALSPVASFDMGSVNPITITGSGTYALDAVNVWIDYNHDGDFTDNGELVFESDLGAGPYSGNVTIPAGAILGNTRMRIRIFDAAEVIFGNDTDGPCGTNEFGEVEDYTVNIAPCKPVVFTAATANTTTTCGNNASFTATATGTGLIYQWQYRAGASGTWLPVTETGIYSGSATATLSLTNISEAFNGYEYRPLVSGFCSGIIFGSPGILTVNKATPVITPAAPSFCVGGIQQLTLTNTTSALLINEGFNTASPLPTGWAQQNRSNPAGAGVNATWRQGTADPFPANSGGPTSYIKCDWRSTTALGTISNWLFTPVINMKNGDVFTFYTRVPIDAGTQRVEFPDRMQVRLSTNAASTNVGTTATSVGDFSRLLLDINPDLTVSGYPIEWKRYTITISGIATPVSGRIAFRYFVTEGGSGADAVNSNVVGVDDVTYESTNLPAQGIWTSASPATMFTDATATTPYVAGTPATSIFVKPAVTTDYSVTYSTPTPCASATGTVTVVVGQPITGTSTVANQSVCINHSAVFTASAPTTGSPIRHQWKVSTDGGNTFTNIAGATTATLTIPNVTAAMNGYKYKDSLFVTSCASFINTNVATLTVNPAPVLVVSANPYTSLYPSQTTTITVASNTTVPANGYTWYKDSVLLPGVTGNTHVVDVDGAGTYTIGVIDANGCANVVRAAITIGNAANNILFIYPSPNNGQFQVRYYSEFGPTVYPRLLNMYDSKGSRVYSKSYSITSPYTRLDVDATRLPKGIYGVELIDFNGNRIKTGRVVIQ